MKHVTLKFDNTFAKKEYVLYFHICNMWRRAVILKKIFVLKYSMEVDKESAVIIQRIKNNIHRGFGKFTNHSFKLMMTSKVGIHRIRESCYVSGVIQDTIDGCIIQYSIYPGVVFLICSTIYLLFLIGSIIFFLTFRASISEVFLNVLIIGTMFFLIEVFEIRRHERWCNKKMVDGIEQCIADN